MTTSNVTAIQRTGQQLATAQQGQQVTAPTIVAMTTAVSAAQLATIVTAASSATVLVSCHSYKSVQILSWSLTTQIQCCPLQMLGNYENYDFK